MKGLWLPLFHMGRLHKAAKAEMHALMYFGTRPIQERIDEDGGGAVFAALRMTLP